MLKRNIFLLASLVLVVVTTSSTVLATEYEHKYEQEQQRDSSSAAKEGEAERRLQSSNARVVAEAFECDEYQQPVSDTTTPKPIGYDLRICIQPSTPTRNRKIVMRSIDDWTFYKNFGSTVQKAVENKGEVGNTLMMCIPGQVICSFKTQLKDDFFFGATNGTVSGTGTVSMQVAYDDDDRRSLRSSATTSTTTTSRWLRGSVVWREDPRQMQVSSVAGGYAGSNGVTMEIPVDGVARPKNYVAEGDEDIISWWSGSPIWLRVLIIISGCTVVLMGICLCCMCCYAVRDYSRDVTAAKQEAKEDDFGMDTSEERDVRSSAWNEYEPNDFNTTDESNHGKEYPTSTSGISTDTNNGLPPQPTDNDICFDADDHPGTIAMHASMHITIQKYPDQDYDPAIYRHIKKQLPGRQFFVCDDEHHPDVWREVPKQELVELFRKEFDDVKSKYNGKQSRRRGPSMSPKAGRKSTVSVEQDSDVVNAYNEN
jgi:hypothetical protein